MADTQSQHLGHDSDSGSDDGFNDPFSLVNTTHPAIGESCGIAADIYDDLFNDILKRQVFDRWINHEHSWQVHCLGGPGAGKTTFSALAVRHIRKFFVKSSKCTAHVASVFIQDVVIENELVFLEDFLNSVHRQLTRSAVRTSHAVSKLYEKYSRACDAGLRTSVRIESLKQALLRTITDIVPNGKAFLFVDNTDQCSVSLQELLQRELATLQKAGLKIMVTSRLPRNGRQKQLWCDFHQNQYAPLEVYWHCTTCEKSDICLDCFQPDMQCKTCGSNTMWTEPEYLNLHLDSVSRKSICDFISWDLEREHGDLGLKSTVTDKPPLSQFGVAFRRTMSGTVSLSWVQQVAATCMGSVVQAKLALDRLHDSDSPDKFDLDPNRMPVNVQTLYGRAILRIRKQSSSQQNLALKTMAAVGRLGDSMFGIPLSELAALLRERPHAVTASIPPRSFEDVLDSALGYLRLTPPSSDDDDYAVSAFNPKFYIYIMDDYNDEIVMANSLLRITNIRKSATYALSKQEPSGNFWEKRTEYQSPDSSAMSFPTSPPVRHGTFSFSSTHSHSMPVDPKTSAPPMGLGLLMEPTSYVGNK